MPVTSLIIISVLLLVVTPAAIADCKTYKIPNQLNFLGIVSGFVIWGVLEGGYGILIATKGMLVAFGIFIMAWLLGWMGAGDVKLIAAVGAIVGYPDVLPVIAGIAFAGFFLSLSFLMAQGMLGNFLQRCWVSLGMTVATKNFVYLEAETQGQSIKLPYGIAIAVGSSLTYMLFCM